MPKRADTPRNRLRQKLLLAEVALEEAEDDVDVLLDIGPPTNELRMLKNDLSVALVRVSSAITTLQSR